MVYLEKLKNDHLAVQKVAWLDWWTDGFGSAMNETKAARDYPVEMDQAIPAPFYGKGCWRQNPPNLTDVQECYDNLLL